MSDRKIYQVFVGERLVLSTFIRSRAREKFHASPAISVLLELSR